MKQKIFLSLSILALTTSSLGISKVSASIQQVSNQKTEITETIEQSNDEYNRTNDQGIKYKEIKTDTTWIIEFENGDNWDIQDLADTNDVYAESLRDSIVMQMGADRFSPFAYAERKTPSKSYSETISLPDGRVQMWKYFEDATAYLATGNPTASGKTPALGMVAMGKTSSGSWIAGSVTTSTSSQVKFGETLYFNEEVTYNNYKTKSVQAEDRGPGTNRSTYWIDLFFGANNAANQDAAKQWGVKQMSYYWNY